MTDFCACQHPKSWHLNDRGICSGLADTFTPDMAQRCSCQKFQAQSERPVKTRGPRLPVLGRAGGRA